ncbi:MAG TPA: hypothetical protein VEI02_13735 [Planctomycetota bacterium]|nr:hypothetical protein [Planctomycetota bacterium]
MHRRTIAAWTLFAALGGVAPAQADFVAVNIAPALDTIYYADLDALPVAAQTPVATLAGNFIRGIELTAEKTGWYVATSASAGSPTGFYRLEDGVSTLVAPLPFTSTASGALAFGPGEAFLWWIVDPPVGDDSLYRIDFDGTFTLVGVVAFPGVTTASVHAAATDPDTGLLYVVETASDSLYVVDQVTAQATLVGPLGVSVSAIGGMDFSLDGTNRLFYAAQTVVYVVDKTTGAAGASVGSLPSTTSGIAAIPGRVTLKTSPLQINTPVVVTLSGGTPGDPFTLFASPFPGYLQLPGFGVVRIDPFTAFPVVSDVLDASGGYTFTAFLPNDPNLIGIPINLQAVYTSVATLTTRFTNATSGVIQ